MKASFLPQDPASVLYQVFSRPSDVNGNPYRLVLVYDAGGEVTEAYEERASTPNIVGQLHSRKLRQLPTFALTPAEYKATRRAFPVVEV